jgi:hypothetical protein
LFNNKLNSNLIKCNYFDDAIPNQFIISKIFKEFINETNFIIIKGKLFDDLKYDMDNLKIYLIYPKKSIKCFIKSTNKYIQAYIYCIGGRINHKKILINNQIIYSKNCNESLLLINKEIYYQNYHIINTMKIDNDDIIKQKNILLVKTFQIFDYIICFILLIFLKFKVKNVSKNYK